MAISPMDIKNISRPERIKTTCHIHFVPDGERMAFLDEHKKLHNDRGPALYFANGAYSFFLQGEVFSFDNYVKEAEWSESDIIEWKLLYG